MEKHQITSATAETVGQPEEMVTTPVVPEDQPTQEGGSEVDLTSAPDNGQPDAKTEEAQRREAGALAKAQREANAAIERARQIEERFTKIANVVSKDEKLYREALIESGWSQVDAETQVNNLKSQGYWNSNGTVAAPAQNIQSVTPQVDPYKAAAVVIEQTKATDALIEAYPELRESNEQNNAQFQQAFYMANALRQINPSIPLKDALIKMYGTISDKTSQQIQDAQAKGRIQGIAEATVSRQASAPAPVAQTTKQPTYNLTAEDRERAKEFGMSEENYYKRKTERVTMVD